MGYTLAVLGCGTMGVAILSGVLTSLDTRTSSRLNGHTRGESSEIPSGISTPTGSTLLDAPENTLPGKFIVTVGRQETGRKLRKTFEALGGQGVEVEVRAGEGNVGTAKEADVILLCTKPQVARSVLAEEGMKEALEGKLVVPICSGITIAQVRAYLAESTTVVRAMPNVASKIGEGMTVVSPCAEPLHRALVLNIFSSCGRCRFLDEKYFDACTALAGSGPAFVAVVLEAMVDGAVMMGMPRAEAMEIAAQMVKGTGQMALVSGLHPAQLKDSVTTPGGCTIAGLLVMEDGRIRSTLARAIQTATNHAAGLGQAPKQ